MTPSKNWVQVTWTAYAFCSWWHLANPCFASSYFRDLPVVNTTLGQVRGIVDFSRLGREYHAYLGIPYAEPPEGQLRFESPKPLKAPAWKGIRAADTWASPCLQFDAILRGRVLGQEDCLYLNIFTPKVDPQAMFPVAIWIHGGGFVAGSSDMYDPKYFMDHDIVLVSMNYRLASLGFLNTGDDIVRGNMGLKDQNLAMRFVQDNIQNFGGNRSRVTLIGESAGSASVHYHVLSPLSRELFHRAIMQSGNIFCPWAHTRSSKKQAMRFGESLDCPIDNTSILVQCLKRMDGRRIVKKHASILSPIHTQDDFFPGSVEAVQREDTFLSENPFMMVQRGDFNRIPVIFGMNSGEGALKTARLEATPEVLNTLDTQWHAHVPILLHYNPAMKNVSEQVRHYYCPQSIDHVTRPPESGTKNVCEDNGNSTCASESDIEEEIVDHGPVIPPQETLENVTHMISDGIWYHATREAALHHAKFAPVYLAYFSYHSTILPSTYTFIKSARERNTVPAELTWPAYFAEAYFQQIFFQQNSPKRFGACHGDDLMYYWATNPFLQIRPASQDYPFSKKLVTAFVDFISHVPDFKFGDVRWDAVPNRTQNESAPPPKLRYMKLDKQPEMIEQPFHERIEFIHSLNIRDPHDPNNW